MSKQSDQNSWETFFQSLQMTFYSLLALPLFIFAIAFLRAENGSDKIIYISYETEIILVSAIAIIAFLVMVLVYFYSSLKYKEAAAVEDIEVKLGMYRKATLLKYYILCITQIATVIVFLATYHNGLMGIFTALLLYSSFFRPELTTVKKVLKLSKEEYQEINYKRQ